MLACATTAHAGPYVVHGYSSWFSGPCDGADSGSTGSGIPARIPGIALPETRTYGRWFLVVDESSGARALAVHSDYGPAGFTGRVIDLTYSLVARFKVYGGGPCFGNYPNGIVTATKIVRDLRYPSCGWAGRMAGRYLRHRVGKLGRPGNCLHGTAVKAMTKYLYHLHRPKAARSRTVTLGAWRALLKAR